MLEITNVEYGENKLDVSVVPDTGLSRLTASITDTLTVGYTLYLEKAA